MEIWCQREQNRSLLHIPHIQCVFKIKTEDEGWYRRKLTKEGYEFVEYNGSDGYLWGASHFEDKIVPVYPPARLAYIIAGGFYCIIILLLTVCTLLLY